MDTQRRQEDLRLPTPTTLIQLPEKTKEFLGQLRDEEVDTLERFARLSREEQDRFFAGVKFINSAMSVGRVVKWAMAGLLGMFFGTMLLWDQIQKFFEIIGRGSGK